MPQLDFRKALSSPGDPLFTPPVHNWTPTLGCDNSRRENHKSVTHHSPRLGRSDWANLGFAMIALAGGLICAFCFFNGSELMRAMAAWPGEFLYARPPITVQTAKIGVFDSAAEGRQSSVEDQFRDDTSFGLDLGSFEPPLFSGFLPSNQGITATGPLPPPTLPPAVLPPGSPQFPPTLPRPSSDSLLGQMNILRPGADALSQIFNQGVATVGRMTIAAGKTQTATISTAHSLVSRKQPRARLKATTQVLTNHKPGAPQPQPMQSVQPTSRDTVAIQRSSSILPLNSGIGPVSPSGLGGSSGSGAGILGGRSGLGGGSSAGGSVGSLVGGRSSGLGGIGGRIPVSGAGLRRGGR